ncbi:LysR family transcriptional regulator [Accumulibacter sp.]|uniref:LysR family transcriptional regulator n=1 Tax=Accumulibacter sp. TaxID=2053492 RepID=UPI0025FB8573|nr:LysR family transcriptional regulator [Accumulibacter sp.]MCM8594926.1 LysR family transcriptional regulator [Accumulibacter sp.]MCM8625937.1 LysR family transcriptional regulator [Accumulibacter sp.]MDS4049072.1 LysR family transcriptional regulator [Accumulibacter sp.]
MADRRLQVFHAVARHLSFTKAGEALHMTQPAVTFQIKQLEERFNTRLFERGGGRISLTAAGELVLDYAERILTLSNELDVRVAEMTGQMSGSLLVGASTTIAEFLLPPILGEFNVRYPQVRARLTVANAEAISNALAAHTLDIGLIESPVDHPSLQSEVCGEDELQVVCTPDHPLARRNDIDARSLLMHDFIAREPGSGTREVTDDYFRACGVEPEKLHTVMELSSPEALKGVVGTGLGCAIVSRASFEKERQLGSLVAVPLRPRLKRSLSLVYAKERFRSRVVLTFVDFARSKLRELSV